MIIDVNTKTVKRSYNRQYQIKMCMICNQRNMHNYIWGMCEKCFSAYNTKIRQKKHINCINCKNAYANKCLKIQTNSRIMPEHVTKYERTGNHVLVLECTKFASDEEETKEKNKEYRKEVEKERKKLGKIKLETQQETRRKKTQAFHKKIFETYKKVGNVAMVAHQYRRTPATIKAIIRKFKEDKND